ncbi:MAG TPA: aminopeptidase, partial [Polaribacter sp.]|nr:aminopeptidase [Polaribacter sp.]
MKKISLFAFLLFFITATSSAQEARKTKKTVQQGHTDQNKFRQMKDVLATPNDQHAASGAPGHQYTQQKVDYKMDIRLDESANKIYGDEEITYYNNSKDYLTYLWVQLDQNMRADDSKTPLTKSKSISNARPFVTTGDFKTSYMNEKKGFGYNITKVASNGTALSHTINSTMMRINLPRALAPGKSFEFSIQWNYLINDINKDG